MAEIKVPIQVNLPDDWVEQIVDRLRNDPDAEWVEIIRCKDCKWYEMGDEETYCRELGIFNTDPTSYCSYAKRKEE